MPVVHVLDGLDVPRGADDAEIAARLRALSGLTGASLDPKLWIRLLDFFTLQVGAHPRDQVSDMGHLAYSVGAWCVVQRDARWNAEAWLPELAITDWETFDGSRELGALMAVRDRIAGYVTEEIGPRLSRHGLLRAQPYERPEGSE